MSAPIPAHTIDEHNNITIRSTPSSLILISFVIGALSFLTGSIWSNAFRESIEVFQDRYSDVMSSLAFWYISAFLVTILATIVAVIFHRMLKEMYNNNPKRFFE